MKNYFNREKNILQMLIYCFLGIFILFSAYNACRSSYFLMDTIEHLQASWLISRGKMPYRDFFEHHFPLLWYMLAPIINLCPRTAGIIPFFRIFAILGYTGIFWIVYRIIVLYSQNSCKALSVLPLILAVPCIWKDIINLRPDIFMNFFFFLGLYNFFIYLNSRKIQQLVLSYFFLSVSFLFLPKIAFVLLGFATVNLYFLIMKKIKLKHFIIAATTALLPPLMLCIFFYSKGLLSEFFHYNITFNLYVKDYYQEYTGGISKFLKVLTVCSISILPAYKKNSPIDLTLLICSVSAFFSIYHFAPYPQYFQTYWLLLAPALAKIINTKTPAIIRLLCIGCAGFIAISNILHMPRHEKYNNIIKTIAYIINHSSTSDTFLNFSVKQHHLFISNACYHWFGFQNSAVIDAIYGSSRVDINACVHQNPPTFIYYDPENYADDTLFWYHTHWLAVRNLQILKKSTTDPRLKTQYAPQSYNFWQFDTQWLLQNYHPTDIKNLWRKNI